MSIHGPSVFHDVEACVDSVLGRVGKRIVLGLPLGLGKPNQLVNCLYRRAKADPSLHLTICTALSLEWPTWKSDLERRFLEPFVERMFGGYVDLEYLLDLRSGSLPDNIEVKEFYTKAGSYLNLRHAQQNYISSNYTHVYRDLVDAGVNVLGQMVCQATIDDKTAFSLSSNPDVSLDVCRVLRQQEREGRKIAIIAQINQNLPFMYGDAVVDPSMFTDVVDNPAYHFRLFGAPKTSVSTTDSMIGLNASALVKDGGTLQIGIGSLGDAVCHGLRLRHENSNVYQSVLKSTAILSGFGPIIDKLGGTGSFAEGLCGSTEMLVDGYLHLIRCGVVKRATYNDVSIQRLLNQRRIGEKVDAGTLDALLECGAIQHRLSESDFSYLQRFGILKEDCRYEDGSISSGGGRIGADLANPVNRRKLVDTCLGKQLKGGILVHGGFFLGPESFYEELRRMSPGERRRINMTSVLNVNQIYSNQYGSEELKTLQRAHGRFLNACLMVTLSGAVVSDGLENGQMVSGVGGQYNFVSQAHALPNAHSILLCKATRTKGKESQSNIVFNYGHLTIPRHLRDVVVTEYGIADLRGRSDHEIIAALLNIADSRFQDGLLQQAKDVGKIPDGHRIPDGYRSNTPERLADNLAPFKQKGFFPAFPFGTDFTREELVIGKALKGLKVKMAQGMSKISSLGKAMARRSVPEKAQPFLQRLQLDKPQNSKEKMLQKLVINALIADGSI